MDPPYVDHTRIMDGNMLMVKTLLSLDKDEARKALDFIQSNMISEGALYYYDSDLQEASLSGQALANAFALWGFVEGYGVTGDEAYLKTSEKVALFSLDRLYDWNSGGFFSRNSEDVEFYAPNERIDLVKPYRENAVFGLGLMKLYLATENLLYLDAALKTVGFTLQVGGGFDESYYTLESVRLIKEHKLLDVDRRSIAGDISEFQQGFWLDDYLESASEAQSLDGAPKLPNDFADSSFIILAIIAFLAGILSFLSPCTLPVLTAYFAQSLSVKRGEILRHTISFFIGLALVFSAFGMGATFLGILLRDSRLLLTQIAGIVIILFGIFQLFGKGFSGLQVRLKGRKTYFGSFLFGIVFGVGWSACIGPILASLLLLSATTGTVVKGSSLLFVYALGLGLPLIVLSFFFDKIKDHAFWKFLQGSTFTLRVFGRSMVFHTIYVVSGVLLIIIGILIYQDFLYSFNELALQTPIVQKVIIKGEELLKGLL
mgnify:CR=1 FL=1